MGDIPYVTFLLDKSFCLWNSLFLILQMKKDKIRVSFGLSENYKSYKSFKIFEVCSACNRNIPATKVHRKVNLSLKTDFSQNVIDFQFFPFNAITNK